LPQLPGSLVTSMQAAPQSNWPAGHAQVPPLQLPLQQSLAAAHVLPATTQLGAATHVKFTDAEFPVHAAPESATVAVTVTVTEPTPAHVKVGDALVVLLNVPIVVPPVTAHENVTSPLFPTLSTPCADRVTVPPTSTVVGLAETEETAAQALTKLRLPLTATAPLPPASAPDEQETFTVRLVVDPEVTVNCPDPLQSTPFNAVPVNVIV
jgi:hypothetical protein